MDVSIVIVSFNTCHLLDECIASIERETRCSHEVIVVDNASTDGSPQMLREKYQGVTIIENTENVGFARANNQGFSVANGKYFFMLNPDTVILDGAIDKLVEFMENNPDVGICGPRNVDRDGKLQYSCDHFPSFWNTFCYYSTLSSIFPGSPLFNRCWMRYWDYGQARDVERMTGCSLLIRSDVYKELYGLDEKFFMYFEETDLCYRTHKSGLRNTYLPSASIIHYGGESSRNNSKEVIGKTVWPYFYESQYYFFKKNYGMYSMLAIRSLDFLYGAYLLLRNSIRVDVEKRAQFITLGRVMLKMAIGWK